MATAATIRPARAGDAVALAALGNELARAQGYERDAMTPELVLADLISGAHGLDVLVAEQGDVIVGYALHHVAYESAHAVRGRYLSDLYVVPAERRRGVARALMAEVARRTAQEGGKFVWWVSKGKDEAARRLYAKLADIAQPVTAHAVTYDNLIRLGRTGAAKP